MRSMLRTTVFTVFLVALAACGARPNPPLQLPGLSAAAPEPNSGGASTFSLPANVVRACAANPDPSFAHCLALVRTDVGHDPSHVGVGPSDLQSAYALPSASQGTGQTIAIVDAYDDPNLESDLAMYRSNYGLAACTTSNGCFKKVDQQGRQSHYPRPDPGWAIEESLDVDMVSAVCPNCHVLVVESNNSSLESLGRAVDEAVKLGADVVSNSYIGYGMKGTREAEHYDHPGTILTVAGGDFAYR
ncbi:MAG TPA: hypothetical protein VIJ77_08860, partial [Candidatus Tumulicola sp.]